MIRIKDFAETHNRDPKAVSRWMKMHNIPYDRNKGLSEAQIALLEKQYPLPKPIEVIVDTESREQLLKTQEQLIHTQQALLEAQKRLLEAEAQKILLEDKQARIEALEHELSLYERTVFGLYKKTR